jgi:AraC-like DNA-binding protein
LSFYRYERPQAPQWEEVRSLSLCVVVQGRKRVRVGSTDYFYDPFHYFVMTRGLRFQAEILECTTAKPFLSFLLQVEPSIINRVMTEMHEQTTMLYQRPVPGRQAAYVSGFDQNLMGAILRFLRAIDTEADRRVLAPIYLQEMVYRLIQTEQCSRLAQAAMHEAATNPVSAAIRFMCDDLSSPITVADLADAVAMSQSAFAHLFKSVTGVSPYQFMKNQRLDRARGMLVEQGRSVSDVAVSVGYSSLSHFINEFKRHYGVTPGQYASQLRDTVPLSVSQTTGN